jgi:DNA-binding GntR family transcriptional regulator
MVTTRKTGAVMGEQVAEVLAERILTGQLKPGERIKLDELATELKVSRIPVRDAVRTLEARGLVTIRANSGARVASLTVRDMEISYRIREQLEPMLLGESIPRLTAGDLADLAEARDRLDAVTNLDDYMPLSRAFHWTAFRRHEAPLLAQMVERLWDTTQSYRRAYAHLALADAGRMQIMRDERALLFGAITRREAEFAAEILALHIRRTHHTLAEYFQFHDTLEA